MLFLTLPLAFALSWALCYVPGFSRVPSCALRLVTRGVSRLTRRQEDAPPAPAVFLLVCLLSCLAGALLDALHPLTVAVLLAPLIPLPAWLRECLLTREELENGQCATQEERDGYERRVTASVALLAQRCARSFFMPLLLVCVFTPLRLGACAAWAFYALAFLDGAWPLAHQINASLSRAGEAVFIAFIIPTAALCGIEMGMAARARHDGAGNVLLSAVGVDPAFVHGHRPVTGDISQACLCVCVACVLLCALVSVPVLLALTGLGLLP